VRSGAPALAAIATATAAKQIISGDPRDAIAAPGGEGAKRALAATATAAKQVTLMSRKRPSLDGLHFLAGNGQWATGNGLMDYLINRAETEN
jgi:hypothetical protein